ncbi:TPA: lysine transporter LysE [Candidatus Bathyarchaeota archaeon]|nr:lysine transporter LysE [Candidatus Bathyarchaeota archaeon]
MEALTNLPLFLVSVVMISLSGVMMPGPVFAVTVAKGRRNGNAGAYIALGHGIVEVPLMILIYLGFSQLFMNVAVKKLIGLVGGAMLIYMGYEMFKSRRMKEEVEAKDPPGSSLMAGVVTTGANPYFFLWWATIGATLVSNSAFFGLWGFLLFALTHWSCDLAWDLFVSKATYNSKRFWTKKLHEAVFIACAFLLLGFGAWFVFSSL